MEPKGSVLCSQELAIGPCPESDESNPLNYQACKICYGYRW